MDAVGAGTAGTARRDMGTALDEAPLTRRHLKVWALAAFGIFLDGFDLFIIGVALPLLQQQWDLSPLELGLIPAAAVLGALVGALTMGPVIDRIGRKRFLTIDLALFVVFAAASALSWDVWPLIVFRFFLGFGIGADYPVSASYVAEVMPARVRGRMLVGAFAFQALGQLFGALVGLVILWLWPDENAWRVMVLVGIVPAVVIAVMRRGVPDSPRWLAREGRFEEAAEVASALAGTPVTAEEARALPRTQTLPLRTLFQARFRRRTALVTAPWFLMDIATYGVGVFTPTILAATAFHADGDALARDIASTEGAAFLDLFLVVGFVFAILLVERAGRIRLQFSGFLAMAAGLAILAWASAQPGGGDENLAAVFIGFILFNVMMNAGPNSTTFALPAEVYPTEMRATAHGFAAAMGKLGASVGIVLFPLMRDDLGLSTTLLLISGGCVLAAVITRTMAVEPRGRTLAELDAAHR